MFTVEEIRKAVDGKLLQGDPKTRARAVSTDTRLARRGELFIAIRGDRFDGHDFLATAASRGIAVVLVSRPGVTLTGKIAVIQVTDTLKALGALARHHRLKFRVPVIAVTGSAGKTTTKEFIAAVLKKKYRVLYNKGTENNQIGVPMTLLRLDRTHQAAVIETGTNHPGEIEALGQMVCPTIALYTNIGASHLAGLGTPEGVLREKAALVPYVLDGGTVIVNGDDPLLRRLSVRKKSLRRMTYAIDRDADVRARGVRSCRGGFEVTLGEKETFRLATPVWGNVSNALAAVACGKILKVPFAKIASALARVKAAKGRQCFHRVRGITIIDDTYNANPVSYRNAIRTLTLLKKDGHAFLVAADMLELGDGAEALHAAIGEEAGRAGIDRIITIGRWAGRIGEQARQVNPAVQTRHALKVEDISAGILQVLSPGDVVLVKGSRGMKMERVVEELLNGRP